MSPLLYVSLELEREVSAFYEGVTETLEVECRGRIELRDGNWIAVDMQAKDAKGNWVRADFVLSRAELVKADEALVLDGKPEVRPMGKVLSMEGRR